MIERICQQCGQTFLIKVADAKRGHGKFCSRICKNKSQVGKHPSREARAKMSEFQKAHPNSGQFKKGLIPWSKGKSFTKKTREAISRNHPDVTGINNPMYGRHRSKKVRAAISKAQKKRYQNPEERRKTAEISRALWGTPEFVAKVIRGRAVRPTEPERKLIDITRLYFPDFKYNGNLDQGVMLNYLIPDFVNVNGKKELIEVFGDYFHSPKGSKNKWHRSELGRVMAYNSVGWKCLVIWEWELNELTKEEIIGKIARFFRRRHVALAHL